MSPEQFMSDTFYKSVGLTIKLEPDDVYFRSMSEYSYDGSIVIILYADGDEIKADTAFKINGVWYPGKTPDKQVEPLCWAPISRVVRSEMVPFIKA